MKKLCLLFLMVLWINAVYYHPFITIITTTIFVVIVFVVGFIIIMKPISIIWNAQLAANHRCSEDLKEWNEWQETHKNIIDNQKKLDMYEIYLMNKIIKEWKENLCN